MALIFDSISETGLVREVNQDSIFADEKNGCGLFVVADGMGGHSRGELASTCAIDIIKDWWQRNYTLLSKADDTEIKDMLEYIVSEMNRRVYAMYEVMNLQGGTTIAILLMNPKWYGIATVGDSRIYWCTKRDFAQISIDDVWENLEENVDLTEEMVVTDARYGTLTQALGYDKNVTPRILVDILDKDTVFFLCSDGIYKYFTNKQIEKMLTRANRRKNIKNRIDKIKNDVYKAGAGDNLSGILIKCSCKKAR